MKEVEEEAEVDPCESVHCPAGKECVEEEEEGVCVCVKECGVEHDMRRHVCSNHNQTFQSDCSLYQARCWCEEGDSRCWPPSLTRVIRTRTMSSLLRSGLVAWS